MFSLPLWRQILQPTGSQGNERTRDSQETGVNVFSPSLEADPPTYRSQGDPGNQRNLWIRGDRVRATGLGRDNYLQTTGFT